MSQAIDVGIGLAFTFALISLVCTGLQEMVSAALNLRGKTLWEGVQSMLQVNAIANAKAVATGDVPDAGTGKTVTPADADAAGADPQALQVTKSEAAGTPPERSVGVILEAALRVHPLIVTLIPDRFGLLGFVNWMRGSRMPGADVGEAKPSYLQASTFATVLADKIGETWRGGSRRFDDFPMAIAAMPDSGLKGILQGMVRETHGDPGRLRLAVESWYDETMVRVGGWYKRRIQILLLLMGFVAAAALNIDAIHIASALAANPALAAKVADRAATAAADYGATKASSALTGDAKAQIAAAKTKADSARKQLQDLNLPIGWTGGHSTHTIPEHLLMVAGWLITALAASFGAPFWFDLINKLVPLRSSGAKPSNVRDGGTTRATPAPIAVTSSVADARTAAMPPSAGAVPFRSALNDFELTGLSEAEILQIKRILGMEGSSATTSALDQATRDKIRQRQVEMKWPETGELSASWLAALRMGGA